jgi:hypothetical protein
MLFMSIAAIAVAASLLQDPLAACTPNSALVGTWHFVSANGDAFELTIAADGFWRRWTALKGQPSFSSQGRCLILEDGRVQISIGQIARHHLNPRSLILEGAREVKFLPGALPMQPADRDLFRTWHLTRRATDYGPHALIAEVTFSADGSFRWIESTDLAEPQLVEGTFRVRPRGKIELVDKSDASYNSIYGERVRQFDFRAGGRSLTLKSEDEQWWFAAGNDRRGFPAQPQPCTLEAPATALARLGTLPPIDISPAVGRRRAADANKQMHRAMRAYLGSASPMALKSTRHGDEGDVYDEYLIVRAGRAEYLYTSSGSHTSGETGSCVVSAIRLVDAEGRFVEPSSGPLAPAVKLLFRSGFPGRNSFPSY